MSNIEEDYNLFQLVKRNPINSCIDLSKNMIGKKRGVFYFTERFRIDFENKMSDFERLKAEREQDKKRIKELEEENRIFALEGSRVALKLHIEENYIPKQKVKGLLTEIQKEYEKLYKASDEFLSNEKKKVEDYILEKERLATMQTLAYCRDNLEELLEEK